MFNASLRKPTEEGLNKIQELMQNDQTQNKQQQTSQNEQYQKQQINQENQEELQNFQLDLQLQNFQPQNNQRPLLEIVDSIIATQKQRTQDNKDLTHVSIEEILGQMQEGPKQRQPIQEEIEIINFILSQVYEATTFNAIKKNNARDAAIEKIKTAFNELTKKNNSHENDLETLGLLLLN